MPNSKMIATTTVHKRKDKRKWLPPILYLLFIVISFLPLYAQKTYAPQDTKDVIISLLAVSVEPYKQLAPFFHIATLLIVMFLIRFGERMGRPLAAYMGLNYLMLAFIQSIGTTQKYGTVIHTGALIMAVIVGAIWIVVAARGRLKPSFKNVPLKRYLLLPLALLAFWAPYNHAFQPNFNLALLLTAPDYGLTFCFTTPMFLFLLFLFYPQVDAFAYRITAFNGLLYGLFNLTHFFNPELRWMGVLHLPLLIISISALWQVNAAERIQRYPKKMRG